MAVEAPTPSGRAAELYRCGKRPHGQQRSQVHLRTDAQASGSPEQRGGGNKLYGRKETALHSAGAFAGVLDQ